MINSGSNTMPYDQSTVYYYLPIISGETYSIVFNVDINTPLPASAIVVGSLYQTGVGIPLKSITISGTQTGTLTWTWP